MKLTGDTAVAAVIQETPKDYKPVLGEAHVRGTFFVLVTNECQRAYGPLKTIAILMSLCGIYSLLHRDLYYIICNCIVYIYEYLINRSNDL